MNGPSVHPVRVRARGALANRRAIRLRRTLAPVGRTLFAEPFEQGCLRLGGTPATERCLSVGALVVLIGLLVALVYGDAFRHSTLIRLNDSDGRWTFVPLTLFPVVTVALFAGWLAFLWGALRGSLVVALAGGLAFLIVNGSLASLSGGLGDSLLVRWSPGINRGSYYGALGIVVVFALLRLSPAWGRRTKPVALVLLTASLALFFGSVLWVGLHDFSSGLPNQATLILGGSFDGISVLIQPMVLLATAVLVDFSYNFANAVASPAQELRAATVKFGLAVVILLKLWIQMVRHLDQWRTYLRVSPSGLVWVALSVVLSLSVAAAWRRRIRRRPASEAGEEGVKELIIYIAIAAEVLVALVVEVVFTLGASIVAQTNSTGALHFVDAISGFINRHVGVARAIPWVLVLLTGVWMLTRGRIQRRVELGLGLALVGAWTVPFYVLSAFEVRFQFSNPLFDIVLTVAVGVILAVRWTRIDRFEALALGVVVLFSWMAFTRGDFVSFVAGTVFQFLALGSAIVLVFGIVYALLADSAIASRSSRRFPRESRVPLYLGYLVLSTTLFAWLAITHPTTSFVARASASGFSDIGIPLAAWLMIRRPVTRREAADAALPAEAAAFGVDDEGPPPSGPTFTE